MATVLTLGPASCCSQTHTRRPLHGWGPTWKTMYRSPRLQRQHTGCSLLMEQQQVVPIAAVQLALAAATLTCCMMFKLWWSSLNRRSQEQVRASETAMADRSVHTMHSDQLLILGVTTGTRHLGYRTPVPVNVVRLQPCWLLPVCL